MSDKSLRAAMEKLAKWRKFFASWQLGTTMADDGRYKAVADHRELSILMRAELSALNGLLIRKGVFSQEEWRDSLEREMKLLDHQYEERFPGWRSLPEGLSLKLPEAAETMKELGVPAVKAVICTASGSVHIHTPGVLKWELCQCGCTGAKWDDPHTGTLAVASRALRDKVFGLGLSNDLLRPAVTLPGQMWEDYRTWHDHATDAPGFVFDKAKAGCWAVVFRIGSTSDTRWATDAEQRECFGYEPDH